MYKTAYGLDVSVEIIRDTEKDEAKVKVIAPMYQRKEWIMKHSYSASSFSDAAILSDYHFKKTMEAAYPKL